MLLDNPDKCEHFKIICSFCYKNDGNLLILMCGDLFHK